MPPAEPASAFLARALFDPEHGYYARRVRTVGARGDFSTAATLSPTLGRAVAAWLRAEALRQPGVRDVVEIGAGDGSLLEAVRDDLGPVARRWLRLHVVEASPVLKAQQQRRFGDAVTWHDDLPAALTALGGRAFLFHNEVLDAFPVDVVQWSDHGWQELWLAREGRGVREELRPLDWSDAERADFVALRTWTRSTPPPYRDQRVELQRPVRDWLRSWAPLWKAGAMLTIDYGDVFPDLVERRPRGTLRAYLLHQRLEGEDVWANAGWQDVTCDVDFTDLRAWAAALGWREALFTTQEAFVRARVPARRFVEADRVLLHPAGAGSAFKVLVHRPG